MKDKKIYKILDLGSGNTKIKGSIGMDMLNLPNVDVVHDFNIFPYPFEDNYFKKIVCFNSLEHVESVISVLKELHRISKNQAIIHIESPHFSSCDYFTDPTHKHPFTSRSFDYFIKGTQLYDLSYDNGITFSRKKIKITFYNRIINYSFGQLINLSPKTQLIYERYFAFIIPAHQIIFDLEAIK